MRELPNSAAAGAPVGIRGHLLAGACRELRRLEERGLIAHDCLLRGLAPEDLGFVYAELPVDRWYPISSYERVSRLILMAAGTGGEPSLVELGRRVAAELLQRPIVHALAAAREVASAARSWWQPRGHLLVALPSSLFTHTCWLLRPEDAPGRFTLRVTEAAALPDHAAPAASGLLEELAGRLAGCPVEVEWVRPGPDEILYHGRALRPGGSVPGAARS